MRKRDLWMVLTVMLVALYVAPDVIGQGTPPAQTQTQQTQTQGQGRGQGRGGRGAANTNEAPAAGPLDPVAIASAAAKAVNPADLEYGPAKGTLIIISSVAAFHSTKGNPAYNASKTGAFGLTRTLAQAWAEDGIRVNGIAPGLVDTKMTKVTTANPKRRDGAIENIPLKRLGTPQDMAGAALFLASPLAGYVTGQTLVVDGGLIL